MKTLEEKKEMIENFEGFYIREGNILYENPITEIVRWVGANKFEKPISISKNYNSILGRCVQTTTKQTQENQVCSGGTVPVSSDLFNNSPQLYVLTWNEKLDVYEGELADMNDLTQITFKYDGNKIIHISGFELNSEENKDKEGGAVVNGDFYKTVSNNPTKQEIEDFLSNPENCETIGFVFEQVQLFLLEILNLYQQGKIIQEIPSKWFSDTISCPEQSKILNDNLLAFYININPNYYQTYLKQNIDIDNILKLYN
jgi:hypothetical protein